MVHFQWVSIFATNWWCDLTVSHQPRLIMKSSLNSTSIVSWCLYKHMSDQNVWREEYRFFISFLGDKQWFSLWVRDGLNWRYGAWLCCGKGSLLEKEKTERKDFVCQGVGRFQIDGCLNWDCITCHKFISKSELNQRSREEEWVSGSRSAIKGGTYLPNYSDDYTT